MLKTHQTHIFTKKNANFKNLSYYFLDNITKF